MNAKPWLRWALLAWMFFVYAAYCVMVKDAGQVQRLRRGIDKVFARKGAS